MSYHHPVPDRPHENSGTHIVISWIVTVLTGFYMLPWAIAATRHKENTATIALLNVFVGWSGIGWIVALVLACLSDPVRQVAPPPHPAQGWYGQQAGPPPALTTGPPPQPYPGYQSSFAPGHPYHEVPRHPEASPYGPPPAFGASSTDPFSTYPTVDHEVVEGPVDDRYRG